MWFYNDSLHTGSICCQRNPLKAALASHVYYFLLLWQICIFSFGYFLPLKRTLQKTCLILALSTWIVTSEFERIFTKSTILSSFHSMKIIFKNSILCISYPYFHFSPTSFSPPFSAESHISTCFPSALLSLLVESQSA